MDDIQQRSRDGFESSTKTGSPTRLQRRDEQSSNRKTVFLMFYRASVFTGGENILWSRYSRAFQAHFLSWYHWSQNEACLLCVLGFAFLWMKVITDANIYLLKIKKKRRKKNWNECLWSSGCSECKGIRVLSGFKIHPGGNPGQLQPSRRGEEETLQRETPGQINV